MNRYQPRAKVLKLRDAEMIRIRNLCRSSVSSAKAPASGTCGSSTSAGYGRVCVCGFRPAASPVSHASRRSSTDVIRGSFIFLEHLPDNSPDHSRVLLASTYTKYKIQVE